MLIDIFQAILFIVFIFSSLLLIVVILLQEGKGGGLASAFGGMGGEAFGVGAGGINRFTGILAAVFIGSAILLASIPAAQERCVCGRDRRSHLQHFSYLILYKTPIKWGF